MIATKAKSAARQPVNRRWTFDEMLAGLGETNQPTELWDGELIMSPAPSFFHQQVVDRFHDALKAHVRLRQLGNTGLAPLDMVLTNRRVVQPDVVFIAKERLHIIQTQIMGAADLVAEVLSPESRRRDRIDKRDLYEQHGVKEFWLIDPEAGTVEVLHLTRGEYELVGRWHAGETAESRLLDGFRLNVAEVLGKS